jgi:hypothetical protein
LLARAQSRFTRSSDSEGQFANIAPAIGWFCMFHW